MKIKTLSLKLQKPETKRNSYLYLLVCNEIAHKGKERIFTTDERREVVQCRSNLAQFLGGLSLHLNHLIASRVTNYDWPFGTLPFGLFGSNLDTRDLETYPRTYSGHF